MSIEEGSQVWIPCQVKPGPFPDERMVRVQNNGDDWLGFVPVSVLKDPTVTEGENYIRATVVEVQGNHFTAMLPGHAFTSSAFHGEVSKVRSLGSIQA